MIPDQQKKPTHTSVVYFHGMGEQRAYAELSRLVDALDMYSHGTEGKGILRKIVVRLEEGRGKDFGDQAYIRAIHRRRTNKTNVESSVRFYECFWAPVTAGGNSYKAVLVWIAKLIPTPITSLLSPWREKQRLRRASLHRLWDRTQPQKYDGDLKKMLDCYDSFEQWQARRDFPKGNFADFRKHLESTFANEPNVRARLLALAGGWRRRFVASELTNLCILMSIGLAALLALLVLIGVAFFLLNAAAFVAVQTLSAALYEQLGSYLSLNLPRALVLAGLLAATIGVIPFLRNYLGDVQFWCTYEETDEKHVKRQEILKRATDVLKHVLEDPGCSRVVIVAHSLGTAIAHDALLNLRRYNQARNIANPIAGPVSLEKLSHFITLGCPIDKIHYFFERTGSKTHRYIRVVEALRGDIGTEPFSKNRHPYIHWVNIWDVGDFVSSSLESPTNKKLAYLRVDNLHLHNFRFPKAASHSAYFNNSRAMAIVGECIFTDRPRPTLAKSGIADGESSLLFGPGKIMWLPQVLRVLLLLLPWTVLAFALGVLFNSDQTSWISLLAGACIAGFLILVWAYSSIEGHLQPIPRNVVTQEDSAADSPDDES